MLFLRARYYNPADGRFLTTDPSHAESNLYSYAKGNPINRIDPSGLFSRELIAKNISFMDFTYKPGGNNDWQTHEYWGFYALLLNAQEFDYVRVGSLDLFSYPTNVSWSKTAYVTLLNCETILIDNQPLNQYFETVVKKQRYPLIWWRDTSAMFYDLFRYSAPQKSFADGLSYGYKSDYPQYRSISLGINIPTLKVSGEVNVIVDLNGNFHLSFGGGPGVVFGAGYTESYLCSTRVCPEMPSLSEVTSSIDGICFNGGGIFVGGVNISAICNWPWNIANPSSWTSSITYYSGIQLGGGYGGSLTIPLSLFGVPPNPAFGWKWAFDDQKNGINYSDIIQMGG